jgi:TPR repeat protein
MVRPDESALPPQSPRAEKKPAPKQSAPAEQAASDQPAEKAPDESASNDDAESGGDNALAEATRKTADATPPAVAKTPQAEAPAPTNSADDALVAQGEKYLYGDGAPENCGLAQKSLQTAASHSNARALSMLGAMYATGHCSNRDLPTAYKYFAKALHQDPSNGRIQRDLEVLWRQMNASERQAATRN